MRGQDGMGAIDSATGARRQTLAHLISGQMDGPAYSDAMRNRRQHDRVPFHQQVEVKLYRVAGLPEMEGRTFQAQLSDVSDGGVGLRLERGIPLGTPVSLRVSLADPPSAFIHRGEVRWSAPEPGAEQHHVGIQFLGGSETHMEEWRRAIRQIGRGPAALTSAAAPASARPPPR
jgi:c-di-GMP-binding flagellar brake protein YcgR